MRIMPGDEIVTFIDTGRLSPKEPRKGWLGRFFHSRNMTFPYYTVEAGDWIHEHSHPNDDVWNVIDGQLEITIAGETQVAGPGCAAVIPPDTLHSVKAITAARAIVVDQPRRHSIGGIAASFTQRRKEDHEAHVDDHRSERRPV
jgi:quercetin dioxygenase-like cupin family protein